MSVYHRIADQVMNLSNASVSVVVDLITIETDHEGAAVLADRLEQAERDRAAVGRVSDALDDAQHSLDCVYMNTSFDAPYGCDCTISHIWRALDGAEADR